MFTARTGSTSGRAATVRMRVAQNPRVSRVPAAGVSVMRAPGLGPHSKKRPPRGIGGHSQTGETQTSGRAYHQRRDQRVCESWLSW